MTTLWIVEKRTADGALDFSDPQPERFFGMAAITGISEDGMAKTVHRLNADVVLDGRFIAQWPTVINPSFKARRKTW
jgi:hypothetical protein